MKEPVRTIGYICPACRQSVIADRSVFALCASKTKLPCPCGKSTLVLEPVNDEFHLTVPCAFCKGEQRARVSSTALLRQKAIALSCAASGLDCCYVGEEQPVYAAMRRLEEAVDNLGGEPQEGEEEKQPDGTFLNELVMQEVLGELKDIAQRGGVSCGCGRKRWRMTLHYSAVELICADCGAKLRIPAATQSDIEDICCKNTILIPGR